MPEPPSPNLTPYRCFHELDLKTWDISAEDPCETILCKRCDRWIRGAEVEGHQCRRWTNLTRKWRQMSQSLLKRAWPEYFKMNFPEMIIDHKLTMLKRWRSICSQWIRFEFIYGQATTTCRFASCILPIYINSIKPDVNDSEPDDSDCLPDIDIGGWLHVENGTSSETTP